MKALRTPDSRFENLPDYPFSPNYVEIDDTEGGTLRLHYLDEGASDAAPVLLMHGEPTWSFLYRKMIPILVEAGCRVIAPDLIGFGRSDKPTERTDYTYARHVAWVGAFVTGLDLKGITLVCQDWGGLIGLRLLAAWPKRFDRAVAANTFLPTGKGGTNEAFMQWRDYSQNVPVLEIGKLINRTSTDSLSDEVIAAYDAPFPDDRYKAGARVFPTLVPISEDDPESAANKQAWAALSQFQKPFLTAFSDRDPIMRGLEAPLQKHIPGAQGLVHPTIKGGSHFLQEDRGEDLARVVVEFIRATS